jgi:hypothetical protein
MKAKFGVLSLAILLTKGFSCCGFPFTLRPPLSCGLNVGRLSVKTSTDIQWNISRGRPIHSLKSLHTKNDDADERSQGTDDASVILSLDPRLVVTDLLAIAMACQLMGLIDVLNDAEFWNHGGWFQPVLVPTTLLTLIQRFSMNSFLWICVAGTIQSPAFQTKFALASSKAARPTMMKSLSIFTLLRLGISLFPLFLVADATSPDLLNGVATVLRECYFVAIATTTGRFVFQRLQERF